MFDHYPPAHRAERSPTDVELWAKREAKSSAMAADLLTRTQLSVKYGAKRRACYTALLTIAAIVILASFLSH